MYFSIYVCKQYLTENVKGVMECLRLSKIETCVLIVENKEREENCFCKIALVSIKIVKAD
jgi:hypothetical protein